MAEAYPLQIRTLLRASKSRSQPSAFRMIEPRRGFAYSQASGTDTPVFWDVAFRFTEDEALIFDLWFRFLINRGADPFTMSIRTEYGVVEHECRFLPENLLSLTEDDGMFFYRATIMARELAVPDGYAEAAALIVGLPTWTDWADLLDQTVTEEMPA